MKERRTDRRWRWPTNSELMNIISGVAAVAGLAALFLRPIINLAAALNGGSPLTSSLLEPVLDHTLLFMIFASFAAFAWLRLRELKCESARLSIAKKYETCTPHLHKAQHELRYVRHRIDVSVFEFNATNHIGWSPDRLRKEFYRTRREVREGLTKVLDNIAGTFSCVCGKDVYACVKIVNTSNPDELRVETFARDGKSANNRETLDKYIRDHGRDRLDQNTHFLQLYLDGPPWAYHFGSYHELQEKGYKTAARNAIYELPVGLKVPVESAMYGAIAMKKRVVDADGKDTLKNVVHGFLYVDSPEMNLFGDRHEDVLSMFCDSLFKPIEAYVGYSEMVERQLKQLIATARACNAGQ